MKFIGRDRELDALERTRLAAQNIASRMTLLTGEASRRENNPYPKKST